MNKKLKIVFVILFFILGFIIIEKRSNKKAKQREIFRNKYFNKFDLELKGVICDVGSYVSGNKVLQTLKVLKSNYSEYNLNIKNDSIVFCVQNNKFAVFTDNGFYNNQKYIDYEIGDTVYLGYNKATLIKCVNKNGNLKFYKKRRQALLYNIIDSPTPKMKKQLKKGCD